MSLLREYTQRFDSIKQAYEAFGEDMAARYPYDSTLPVGDKQWVRCRWLFDFRARKTGIDVEGPTLLPVGPSNQAGAIRVQNWHFETYHLLSRSEAGRLGWLNVLRRCMLPVATLFTCAVGFVLALTLLISICALLRSGLPENPRGLALAVAAFVLGGLIFVGLFWLQRVFRRMGRLPSNSDFDDERLKLTWVQRDPKV